MTHEIIHVIQEGAPGTAGELVPLLVPIASFGCTIAIVAVVMFFRHRSQLVRQDLYKAFLEKGEPIPKELLNKPPSRHADLRRGVVLLAGGLGLSLALLLANAREASGFGLIPALIGIGFLVVWKIDMRGPGQPDHG